MITLYEAIWNWYKCTNGWHWNSRALTLSEYNKANINFLTHWGRVTHICVSKLTIIGSNNGLSPTRCQAIICTNAGILSIGPLGTNFSEILIEIHTFSFKKMHLKMSSAKWRPFCLGLNVLKGTTLLVLRQEYSGRNRSQFHDCWCPGYASISNHGIDYIGWTH